MREHTAVFMIHLMCRIVIERTLHLHLFLHARSLLSAAVRLNAIGPYVSQQILLHVVRDLVAKTFERWKDEFGEKEGLEIEERTTTTWPLLEILISRHDLQQSRIFNS